MLKLFQRTMDEHGQALVEYAFILFLVSIGCVIVLGLIGTSVDSTLLSPVVSSF